MSNQEWPTDDTTDAERASDRTRETAEQERAAWAEAEAERRADEAQPAEAEEGFWPWSDEDGW